MAWHRVHQAGRILAGKVDAGQYSLTQETGTDWSHGARTGKTLTLQVHAESFRAHKQRSSLRCFGGPVSATEAELQ